MIGPLLDAVRDQLSGRLPERLAVAVSGGGDSVALLAVMVEFVRERGIELHVITVDHGLREEAKDEIALVTDLCATWDLPHHVEFWKGWNGAGNLQAEARDARYDLMADWAYANGITHVLLGHTADDQAETFVMRLARGAGVDGLSAMVPRRVRNGITWVRPFLRIERSALRSYLRAAQLEWCEDPSNDNRDFERIRIRDALTVLGTLGVHTETLVDVAHNMSQAREALDWQTFLAARDVAQIVRGVVAFDLRKFRMQPAEIARRLLLHALGWTSSSTYPPRRDAVARTLAAIRAGDAVTLGGCQIMVEGDVIWVVRELNAIKDVSSEIGDLWDERWVVTGPEDDPDLQVAPLGYDGLQSVPGWRDAGLPRAAAAASPAVWYDGQLVAAPVVGDDPEWRADLEGGQDAFFAALLSH
ncbi:tRNA lysidine(34) synthetase TilS [uncultured Tateyamaria sp.]|uniref:tRNA lysidine(34) synthetase TilS n=1 Tax=uncultured Tateyamaria sp. TaxID=455651 RepID=UPI002621B87D|nr:tRNA lysidine(34) synthetase TilS [uncultured Tateyamaria sp.]